MPSAARPSAVHRVPGQTRHTDRRAILHCVHRHHAARVAHRHQPEDGQVPEEQYRAGQKRHLQEGVQLVLHSHVHLRAAVGAGRAQLVPDQRGQPESQEPHSTHLPGKSFRTYIYMAADGSFGIFSSSPSLSLFRYKLQKKHDKLKTPDYVPKLVNNVMQVRAQKKFDAAHAPKIKHFFHHALPSTFRITRGAPRA